MNFRNTNDLIRSQLESPGMILRQMNLMPLPSRSSIEGIAQMLAMDGNDVCKQSENLRQSSISLKFFVVFRAQSSHAINPQPTNRP